MCFAEKWEQAAIIRVQDNMDPEQKPLIQRIGWMVLIWALSIAALGIVAQAIRYWIN